MASFALLFLRPRWQPRLLRFGPVGQMALSVYVGQTVIGVLVFFGFGLGLLGRFGNSVTIPMGLREGSVGLVDGSVEVQQSLLTGRPAAT